ncbi:MAG: hypothetical protein ACYCVB_03910 [Bacilli bacterium]
MSVVSISENVLFKEKVNDVVGLYTDPPADAVALSIDEKAGMQALGRKVRDRASRTWQDRAVRA